MDIGSSYKLVKLIKYQGDQRPEGLGSSSLYIQHAIFDLLGKHGLFFTLQVTQLVRDILPSSEDPTQSDLVLLLHHFSSLQSCN